MLFDVTYVILCASYREILLCANKISGYKINFTYEAALH